MAGFKLMAELGGDGRGFDNMIARAQASARAFGSNAIAPLKRMIAGAFTVGAIAQLVRNTTDYADRIDETSTRLGVATGKLQEWEYAAKQSGASAEQLLNFIERLTIAAADPSKTKFFEEMGFNPNGMTPEQVVGKTSSFAQKNSSTDVTRTLSDILGTRISGQLVNTLQSDLDALGQEARKVGAVMDEQTTQALAKLNDQFSILSQILYGNFGPALLQAGKFLLTFAYGLKGAASYAGARTSNVQGVDVLKVAAGGNNPVAAVTGVLNILRDLKKPVDAGSEWDSAMDALDAALAKINETKPFVPGIVDIQEEESKKDVKDKKAIGLQTDALVGVGNFLGRNPGLINDIGAQQLQVQRQQLQVSTRMLSAIQAMGSPSAMQIEVLP